MAHQAGAYSGFCSIKRLGVFLLPLDGTLVHHRVTPGIKFAGTHFYTWMERGTLRVTCLAQEHNTMSSGSAQTRTAPPGGEVTPPPVIEDNEIECLLNWSSTLEEFRAKNMISIRNECQAPSELRL